MRQILLITGGAMLVFSLTMGGFAFSEANRIEIELMARMESRTEVLSESLAESIAPAYRAGATSTLDSLLQRFANDERLLGLAVSGPDASLVASSGRLPDGLPAHDIGSIMDQDAPFGSLLPTDTQSLYAFTTPLHDDDRVIGALTVIQDASYVGEEVRRVWMNNLRQLVLQMLYFAVAIFLLLRFVILKRIAHMTRSIQSIRAGTHDSTTLEHADFLSPLSAEFTKISKSLHQARTAASEEARMRLEKIDSPWTASRLQEFIKAQLRDRPIYVLTNREPYVHEKTKSGIACTIPASGVITALEPVMEACNGTWIAHGSGGADFDVTDEHDTIMVPPEEPRYRLKRIRLTPAEVTGYYAGFSNEALWPLCLMAHTRPIFRSRDWDAYRRVNAKFAKTLLEEIRHVERPVVLVQDYHLALVPAIIKRGRPDAVVALFWHIPWPSATQFTICPWRKEIITGMLGADVLGFHTQQHCNNFVDTVSKEIEARIDYERFSVVKSDHETNVKPYPISIAYPGLAEPSSTRDESVLDRLRLRDQRIILGVDRLDYAKGFLERLKGCEFLFERHPEYIGKVTLLQIGSPTRESIERYREYAQQVHAEVDRINKRFQQNGWKPIVFEHRHYSHKELLNLYQLAEICLITSLHDGMNLVAKEYAAARSDEEGVLVLSQFAGASSDMKGALIINPYSAEETSDTLHEALSMPKSHQHRRMRSLRASVRNYNIYRWSAELLKTLADLEL